MVRCASPHPDLLKLDKDDFCWYGGGTAALKIVENTKLSNSKETKVFFPECIKQVFKLSTEGSGGPTIALSC